MSVIPETSQPAMGPCFSSALAGFLLKVLTASLRDFLLVKVLPGCFDGGASGGDGEASGGDGGASGDGEGQLFFLHWLNFLSAASNFFVHFVHFFLLASTPVARRSEMRSMIMSFIVCALCVPARRQGDGA